MRSPEYGGGFEHCCFIKLRYKKDEPPKVGGSLQVRASGRLSPLIQHYLQQIPEGVVFRVHEQFD